MILLTDVLVVEEGKSRRRIATVHRRCSRHHRAPRQSSSESRGSGSGFPRTTRAGWSKLGSKDAEHLTRCKAERAVRKVPLTGRVQQVKNHFIKTIILKKKKQFHQKTTFIKKPLKGDRTKHAWVPKTLQSDASDAFTETRLMPVFWVQQAFMSFGRRCSTGQKVGV